MENAYLLEVAALECLTNLTRPTNSTGLEISGEMSASEWEICYQNEGDAPA